MLFSFEFLVDCICPCLFVLYFLLNVGKILEHKISKNRKKYIHTSGYIYSIHTYLFISSNWPCNTAFCCVIQREGGYKMCNIIPAYINI